MLVHSASINRNWSSLSPSLPVDTARVWFVNTAFRASVHLIQVVTWWNRHSNTYGRNPIYAGGPICPRRGRELFHDFLEEISLDNDDHRLTK